MNRNAKKNKKDFKLAKNDGQKIIQKGSTMENYMASNENLGASKKFRLGRQ